MWVQVMFFDVWTNAYLHFWDSNADYAVCDLPNPDAPFVNPNRKYSWENVKGATWQSVQNM